MDFRACACSMRAVGQGAIWFTSCDRVAASCMESTRILWQSQRCSNWPRASRRIFPRDNFRAESIEHTTFPNAFADVVISSAALHFAFRDDAQFSAMLRGSWQMLKHSGLFFCRLASSIGMEKQVRRINGRRHLLPDEQPALSRRRRVANRAHRLARRRHARSTEDNGRSRSTVHDHVGGAEDRVETWHGRTSDSTDLGCSAARHRFRRPARQRRELRNVVRAAQRRRRYPFDFSIRADGDGKSGRPISRVRSSRGRR